MRRREFIIGLGGVATLLVPAMAQSQQRIAVIMVQHENDKTGQSRFNAFLRGFEKLGWHAGQNVRIDVKWAGGSAERMREFAADFVAQKPDVIVVSGTPAVAALKRATSSIPIVFVGVNEPVTQGFIASLAHPGGNITGFTQGDFFIVGKSIDLLKAIAPAISRVGLMYNPDTYGFYNNYLAQFQREARWPMELRRVAVRSLPDIEVGIKDFAAQPGGGLAILVDTFNTINQATIQKVLERYPVPHVVPWHPFVVNGGLMSYGPDVESIFTQSADYVNRILKGANPADLPAQNPTKFMLTINLKTAKAGATVKPQGQARTFYLMACCDSTFRKEQISRSSLKPT